MTAPPPEQLRRHRLIALGAVVGLLALGGLGLVLAPRATPPPRHPLTGRQIAGLATNVDWFERSERVAEEQPDQALDRIGITPGMVVADVGAGSGYMTVRLASRVGRTGKVFANELQPQMLALIGARVRDLGLDNVVLVQGREDDARLPDGALDLALLVDVYHELSRPQPMLRSLRRALKQDGRLVLVEYRKEDPSIPIADTHRLSVAEARIEIEAEGFHLERVISGLPRQHIIVFVKR